MRQHLISLLVTVVGGLIVAVVTTYFLYPPDREKRSPSLRVQYDNVSMYYPENIFFQKVLDFYSEYKKSNNTKNFESILEFVSAFGKASYFDNRANITAHSVQIFNDTDTRIENIRFKHEFEFGAYVVDANNSDNIFSYVAKGVDYDLHYLDPGKSISISGFSRYLTNDYNSNFLVLVSGRRQSVTNFSKQETTLSSSNPVDINQYSDRQYIIWILLYVISFICFLVSFLVFLDRMLLKFKPEVYVRLGGEQLLNEAKMIVELSDKLKLDVKGA